MKWLVYLVLAVLCVGAWRLYSSKDQSIHQLEREFAQMQETVETPDEVVAKKESELESLKNEKTFNGILLTFLCAGLVGIFVVAHVLPFLAQRATHAIYDSAEMVEKDVMHDARSLLAQGNYEGAIAAFQQAATADPLNRVPWVEIAKIYKTNLGDLGSAIQTIRRAVEGQEWEINDAAYLMFRLAELYKENEEHGSADAIMHQVIDQFPETRHSANARHKLQEWAAADAAAEEAQFLAKQ